MFKEIDPVDFGFILFCIFVGSGVSFVLGTNKENLGIAKRLYIQFAAFVLFGILALIGVNKKIDVAYIAAGGFILSIGGQKLIHLAFDAYEKSNSIIEFFQLLGKALSAFYKVITLKAPSVDDTTDDIPL